MKESFRRKAKLRTPAQRVEELRAFIVSMNILSFHAWDPDPVLHELLWEKMRFLMDEASWS